MMTRAQQPRPAVRRTVLGLSVLVLVFYLGFYLVMLVR